MCFYVSKSSLLSTGALKRSSNLQPFSLAVNLEIGIDSLEC